MDYILISFDVMRSQRLISLKKIFSNTLPCEVDGLYFIERYFSSEQITSNKGSSILTKGNYGDYEDFSTHICLNEVLLSYNLRV